MEVKIFYGYPGTGKTYFSEEVKKIVRFFGKETKTYSYSENIILRIVIDVFKQRYKFIVIDECYNVDFVCFIEELTKELDNIDKSLKGNIMIIFITQETPSETLPFGLIHFY